MTTPQPNPTDDLEAVAKLLWERFAPSHEVEWPPYDASEYRLVAKDIAALRPAGVGEAEQFERWIETLRTDVIQDEYGYEDGEFSVDPDHWHPLWKEGLTPSAAFARALTAHRAATPAHPDAALMERVRTVLEDLNFSAIPIEMSKPLQWAVSDAALSALGELLSDLKAEAGR